MFSVKIIIKNDKTIFSIYYTVFILSEVEPSAIKSHLSEADGYTYYVISMR